MADPVKIPDGFVPVLAGGRQVSPGAEAVRKVWGGVMPQPGKQLPEHRMTSEMVPFSDEIAAGVSAATGWLGSEIGMNPGDGDVSFGDLYSGYKDIYTGAKDQYREEHPGRAIAGNVLGGAAMGPGAVAKAGSAIANTARGVGAGGLWGGLFGFDEGGNFIERGQNAAVGAGVGATVGALAPVLFKGVGLLTKMVSTPGVAPNVAKQRATAMLQNALEKDGVSAQDLIAKMAEGKPITLADLGPKTKELLGAAYRRAGGAKGEFETFLTSRSAGQHKRLTADVADALGVDPKMFGQITDDLIAQKALASPIYKSMEGQVAPISGDLEALLQRPAMRKAVSKAVEWYKNKGMDMPKGKVLPFEVLDQAKKELDSMARYGKTPQGGADIAGAGSIKGLTKEYLGVLDKLFPDYAAARQASADPQGLKDVLEHGRKFMRGDVEDVGRAFSSLNPSEQEMFRLGAAREIMEVTGRVVDGGDAARMFKTPNNRARLAEIFGDEETFLKFMGRVESEINMQGTKNAVLAGSQTADKQGADAAFSGDVAGRVLDAGAEMATSGPGRGVMSVSGQLLKAGNDRFVRGLNEKVGNEVIGQAVDPTAYLRQRVLPGPKARPTVPVAAGASRAAIVEKGQPSSAPAVIPQGFQPLFKSGSIPQGFRPLTPSKIKTTGDHVKLEGLAPQTVRGFTALQRRWGSALPVKSAVRDKNHNERVGGASKSKHQPEFGGSAIDVDLKGMSKRDKLRLFNMASEVGFTGIGIYDNSVHLDMGERRAWGPSYKSDSIPAWAKGVIGRHMGRK